MQDDVKMTIDAYANRHEEQPRQLEVPEELTSRKSASEIRDLLKLLERRDTSPEVLLASNMISVGVDIQRLALMVVNGQPKTIAEYIQATSRVGRGDTAGLVVTVYNSSRTRDRSHYETFNGWHTGLYREVEATSVTPFAARAVDKAVHSVLVALARHLVPRLKTHPRLTAESEARVRELSEVLLQRVNAIDPDEAASVRSAIDRLIADWIERQDVEDYWVDTGPTVGLMISAEQHAALRASGARTDRAWPTLNSMRDVEPSTEFRLLRPSTPPPTHAS
jgi:superfamily II DNA/RNA helicase